MIYDVIIVGMGPSGLMAGATIDSKFKVLMIDSNNGPGKKLLISGKGQCNYTNNELIENFESHYGKNGRFLRKALRDFTNRDVMNFFSESGLDSIVRDDGKVFPSTFDSHDILNVLMESIKSKGHDIKYNCKLLDFHGEGELYKVLTEKGSFETKSIVFAVGGKSQAVLGSDGKIVDLLKNKGIKIVEQEASLTPLIFNSSLAKLSGIAFDHVSLSCYRNNKRVGIYKGRMLITHKGISGPLVINNSRDFKSGDEIAINFISMEKGDLEKLFMSQVKENGKWQLITFLRKNFGESLTESFLDYVIEDIGLKRDINISEIKKDDRKSIVSYLVDFRIKNIRKDGFKIAMSTKGGISLKEISPKDFQLKKMKNIYVIGEMIDIDGDTGGFNIQGAFSMGRLVGKSLNNM
ncbi:MAG: aminoacetone oxidase family FAD-binding enzyme [Firmicutes bacterium]|jgi:predicted Rossmann fold flavoprotein|nr:aminoacetone oxidase family FAD-binding enzyme [Bacillota bacterium]